MTRVIVSADAEADLDSILDYLALNAGRLTAAAYAERFAAAIEHLGDFPGAGASRPALGPAARIAIVYPYVLIYDFALGDDAAIVLRVLHGKRNITEHMIKRSTGNR